MDKISIIIPTFNREKDLKNTIDSIFSCMKPYEIIVVNDFPKRSLKPLNNTIIINNKSNLGAAGSRNIGAKKASGDILLFLDDDIIVRKNFVEKLKKALIKKSSVVISSLIYKGDKNFGLNNYLNSRGAARFKEFMSIKSNYLTTAFLAIYREDFEKVGGFSEKFKGYGWEDTEFGLKLESRGFLLNIIHTDSIHIHNKNVEEWSNQLINSGKNLKIIVDNYPMYRDRFNYDILSNKSFSIIFNRITLNILIRLSYFFPSRIKFIYRLIFIISVYLGLNDRD
ncbi:MAG: hypothetical protein CR982_06380 [Candidatus Cloacimonadota bacterium]|nr:MAG: hypothetical protein CR982_06380 [Candidatus Cloacimonadota bacterium]PIE77910.1 MAG: hypothetical protein CSA15_10485 [Candidatus Delongbacteria bacterium]